MAWYRVGVKMSAVNLEPTLRYLEKYHKHLLESTELIGTHFPLVGVKIWPLEHFPSVALCFLQIKYNATSRMAYLPSDRLTHASLSSTAITSTDEDFLADEQNKIWKKFMNVNIF